MPFAYRFAVVAAGTSARAELFSNRRFDILINADPGQGISSSLALAASMSAALGVDAMLVCLADMPFVTRAHLSLLDGRRRCHPGRNHLRGRPHPTGDLPLIDVRRPDGALRRPRRQAAAGRPR